MNFQLFATIPKGALHLVDSHLHKWYIISEVFWVAESIPAMFKWFDILAASGSLYETLGG